MPGKCFPSASQQIFSLKGDVFSASWCTTGSGQCHAGPQCPGDRAGQTPVTWSKGMDVSVSLDLCYIHNCSEHFRGPLGWWWGEAVPWGQVWTHASQGPVVPWPKTVRLPPFPRAWEGSGSPGALLMPSDAPPGNGWAGRFAPCPLPFS